jgi:uncharacterized membrane protein
MTSTDETLQLLTRRRSWMIATPFLILLLSAVVLALKWDSIPDRWTIHWGIHGQPDGWATKTILGVFLPLFGAALICGFLEALGLMVKATGKTRKNLSPETANAIAVFTVDLVRLLEIALAVVFAVMGVALPLTQPVRPIWLVLFTFAVIGGAIVFGMVRLSRGVRELKQAGHAGLEGYNGIIYKNPADPRLWVPKISGLGYTLNFAHQWAWPIMIAFLAIPFAVVVVVFMALS